MSSEEETTALAMPSDFSMDDMAEVDKALEDEREGLKYVKKQEADRLYRYRILPPSPTWAKWFEERGRKPVPFFSYYKHMYENTSGQGPKWISYSCPSRNGNRDTRRECNDCEASFALHAAGNKEGAKQLRAKKVVVFMVIDRDDEDAGPQIMEMSAPWTTDAEKLKGQPLTKYQKLERLWKIKKKNLVSPGPDGWDFTILKSGAGQQGTNYEFGLPEDGPCPLSADPEQAAEWYHSQADLPSVIIPPSPDQLARRLGLAPSGGGGKVKQLRAGETDPGYTAQDAIEPKDEEDDW
jgi:hypothetical protein